MFCSLIGASAFHGAPVPRGGRRIVMQQVAEPPVPAASPAAANGAAAPKPAAKPAAKQVVAEPPAPKLDEAMRNMIASKKRVIDAHNDDVQASFDYLNALLPKKEVRDWAERPGPNPEVIQVSTQTFAGDAGWDPLRLADTRTHLLVYREAEVKHGRLAMLGVAGWVAAELWPHGSADAVMQLTAGRAPSVLNGGLGEVSPLFWLALLALFGTVEKATLDYQTEGWQSEGKPWTYTPGDLAFDPLDMREKCAEGWMAGVSQKEASGLDRVEMKVNARKNVDVAEIWHGRAAMLAITGFAAQEAIWQTPVVDQSPIFFATPIYHVLQDILS